MRTHTPPQVLKTLPLPKRILVADGTLDEGFTIYYIDVPKRQIRVLQHALVLLSHPCTLQILNKDAAEANPTLVKCATRLQRELGGTERFKLIKLNGMFVIWLVQYM